MIKAVIHPKELDTSVLFDGSGKTVIHNVVIPENSVTHTEHSEKRDILVKNLKYTKPIFLPQLRFLEDYIGIPFYHSNVKRNQAFIENVTVDLAGHRVKAYPPGIGPILLKP